MKPETEIELRDANGRTVGTWYREGTFVYTLKDFGRYAGGFPILVNDRTVQCSDEATARVVHAALVGGPS